MKWLERGTCESQRFYFFSLFFLHNFFSRFFICSSVEMIFFFCIFICNCVQKLTNLKSYLAGSCSFCSLAQCFICTFTLETKPSGATQREKKFFFLFWFQNEKNNTNYSTFTFISMRAFNLYDTKAPLLSHKHNRLIFAFCYGFLLNFFSVDAHKSMVFFLFLSQQKSIL